jgi:hypothetical protein
MAAQPFRVNFRFLQFNRGWTETYYCSAETPEEATNFADTTTVRRGILGPRSARTTLVSIESRAEANSRIAHIRLFGQTRSDPQSGSESLDLAAVSARYLFTAGSIKRFAWIRGLPDDWTERNPATGLSTPSVVLIENLRIMRETFQGNFIGLGWTGPFPLKIRSIVKTPVANQLAVVSMVAVVGNPSQTVVNMAAPLPALTTKVRFLGWKFGYGLDGLQGVFKVIATAGNQVTIGYRLRSDLVGGLPPNLAVVPVVYQYDNITGGSLSDLSTHDTGGPTGQRRGRRRRAQSRQ